MKLVVAAAAVGAIGCLGLPTAGADLVGFTSPSGNIGCILADGTVRCDVAERDWAPPPRPSDCPDFTDYGQGITLGTTGRASFVCAGDTALGSGPALPYGQFEAGGGVSCTSEPSGMRCSNSDGHGFTISRQDYTLF
ncbi:hypothetical protein GCM10009645_30850 [Mycolicibacterium poriferae]|uniref:Lipoprotein LppI n=1 Tax=Mycolicibacterium poriferae TaxID=39694 RepID=A0A6N4VCJ3_9MYCO|nr:DUF6636 domain-containing protein [Mycolicibacterium poriferae]MCV7265811.1 hypothetical protein [Mycolicibacterium poriferae]BBX51788.1 hypothetical protein MPOR_28140 [Mycolicibacterium poriferae]